MTGKNTDELREKIAWALWTEDGLEDHGVTVAEYRGLAAAVLPIVEAEVRKAKAEAWDEGHNTRRTVEKGGWYLNPYRATETGDRA